MKSKTLILFAFMILWISFACAPISPPPITPSTAPTPAPSNLTVDIGSHSATLKWAVDRLPGKPISGYNIYLTEKSLKSIFANWESNHPEPYNHTPYPGDTDGDINKESLPIDNLINGKTYFASVRTIGINGSESEASNEISFVPVAKGEFILSSNHDAETGGFCFEQEKSLPARDPSCDIYLYAANGKIGLSAPYRLGAGLRKTGIRKVDSGMPFDETTVIKARDNLIIKTNFGRASIVVEEIFGSEPDISARISYIFYQNQ